MSKYKKCSHCGGTGYHGKVKCPQCKGTGKIKILTKKSSKSTKKTFDYGGKMFSPNAWLPEK